MRVGYILKYIRAQKLIAVPIATFPNPYFVAVEGAVGDVPAPSDLLVVLLSEDFVSVLVLLSEAPSPDFVSPDFASPLPEGAAAAFFSA